jgi:O-antigen/teichoic acid export membrane protein
MASLAYAVLWAIIMEGGISVALTREAAADPERLAWTPRLALWKIGLGLAGTAGAVGSGWLLGADRPTLTVIGILALGMVAVSEMRLAFAVFRVVGAFAWEAALSTLQKAVLLLLAAVVLLGGAGATAVALVFTLSYAVAAVLALGAARIHLRRRLGPAPWSGRPHAGFVLGTCAPLLAIELFTSLYFKLDQILLLQLRGAEETGLYAAAYRVIETLLLAVSGAMTVLSAGLPGRSSCVPCRFPVLFVMVALLAAVLRTVCSGEPDSQAHQGAAATLFSNSTGTGTSPLPLGCFLCPGHETPDLTR